MKTTSFAGVSCMVILLAASAAFAAEDILVADFEGKDYGGWTATGDALGTRPSQGSVRIRDQSLNARRAGRHQGPQTAE